MLGEFAREQEADGGLDLAGGESLALVVASQLATLSGDALLDVVDEGVHHGHATLADAGVWVNLLEHLVDVRVVALGGLLLALAAGSLCALGPARASSREPRCDSGPPLSSPIARLATVDDFCRLQEERPTTVEWRFRLVTGRGSGSWRLLFKHIEI